MAEYRIQGENLTAIADKIRIMAQTSEKLTIAQMIYWLGRLKTLAQARTELSYAVNVAPIAVTTNAILVQEETL